jgi:hypothetical protein
LLIFESKVSAGCEMMAAHTPAMTPEPSETPTLPDVDIREGEVPMDAYIFSAAIPCTANLAIVYGTWMIEALVVDLGLELDARFDNVERAHGTVSDAAADAA